MKVTSKGQVTIPKDVREKPGIQPLSEVAFVEEEQGWIFLVKKDSGKADKSIFARVRGSATARMSTEEIYRIFLSANAAVKLPLLTRDKARYQSYFPTTELIAPIY